MREMPQPKKRRYATPSQINEILRRQDGWCPGCGCGCKCDAKLARIEGERVVILAPFDVDHIIPLDTLGGQDIGNLQCLCKEHHKVKTARDMKIIAKGRRLRGETGQGPKRAIVSRNTFTRPDPSPANPEPSRTKGISRLSKEGRAEMKRWMEDMERKREARTNG